MQFSTDRQTDQEPDRRRHPHWADSGLGRPTTSLYLHERNYRLVKKPFLWQFSMRKKMVIKVPVQFICFDRKFGEKYWKKSIKNKLIFLWSRRILKNFVPTTTWYSIQVDESSIGGLIGNFKSFHHPGQFFFSQLILSNEEIGLLAKWASSRPTQRNIHWHPLKKEHQDCIRFDWNLKTNDLKGKFSIFSGYWLPCSFFHPSQGSRSSTPLVGSQSWVIIGHPIELNSAVKTFLESEESFRFLSFAPFFLI